MKSPKNHIMEKERLHTDVGINFLSEKCSLGVRGCIKCRDGWKLSNSELVDEFGSWRDCVLDERWKDDARELGVDGILILTLLYIILLYQSTIVVPFIR